MFVDDTRVDDHRPAYSMPTVSRARPACGPSRARLSAAVPNQGDFVISTVLVEVAASVTTADSVLLGFGIEQLATPAEQADVLGRIVQHLLD